MNIPTALKNKIWLILIAAVVVLLLFLSIVGVVFILADNSCVSCAIYNAIAFVVIMLWLAVFISYFIWATFYYNYNYGIPNSLWHKIDDAKQKKAEGRVYDQDIIDDEPLYNPYKDETFGLPPGTVRGMIAFTLLFGAIALLIVSFGMKNEIEPGNFFMDQYEFFKTAFLMMVAFYFGTRSLKYLKQGDQALSQMSQFNTANSLKQAKSSGVLSTTAPTVAADTATAPKPEKPAPKPPVVTIDTSNPLGEVPEGTKMPPITAIDPMAKK